MQRTPFLLEKYRSYLTKLSLLAGEKHSVIKGEPAKKMISEQKIKEAFSAIKDVVSAFDFDTADAIIEELDSFEIPYDFLETFTNVKKAVRDVDASGVLELLGEIN